MKTGEKRYPRGMIFMTDGKKFTGEAIDMQSNQAGIFYFETGSKLSRFLPYTEIKGIIYDEIPAELMEVEDGRVDFVENDSNKE